VREIVDFLKNQSKYTRLGAKIPKGVILIGPPGTGKTLLAKAVAGEASVPFFSMSGSEFVEMFVGVGASRVRDLFKKAKEAAPSIIFLDEIDAIGQSRGKVTSFRTNDERESTLNQLLAEMDGFEANAGVIVLAATNRAEILDRALMRAGRFDRQIFLNLPTLTERLQIFGVHTRKLLMAPDIDLQLLSRQTPGFSGADIANICNEAALIAARKSREAIQMADFMEAVDRIIGGLERKSKIVSEKEKRIIAFHEAGHVTSSWFLPHADSLLKVSIIPRGKSLGAAWYLPEEHQVFTRAEFMDKICMALGGRAAEELIFGEISSNALDDLERSTKQAYMMVAYYGLDPQLGNVSYYDSTGQYEQSLHKPYSEATAEKIDAAVHEVIGTAYQRAKDILADHRDQLEQVAEQLLLKETLYQEDLLPILGPKSTKPE
jgi:cell division protease FtsH